MRVFNNSKADTLGNVFNLLVSEVDGGELSQEKIILCFSCIVADCRNLRSRVYRSMLNVQHDQMRHHSLKVFVANAIGFRSSV